MKKSDPKGKKTSAMSKHQKILIGIAIAFLLYSVIGFLVLPAVLKNLLEKNSQRTSSAQSPLKPYR